MLVLVMFCHMKVVEQWWISGQNNHSLLHVLLVFGIPQIAGTAHVKLTGLGVLVNLTQVGVTNAPVSPQQRDDTLDGFLIILHQLRFDAVAACQTHHLGNSELIALPG